MMNKELHLDGCGLEKHSWALTMVESRPEQPRQKRALQKENSFNTRNLEAAVHWSPEVLSCNWHDELRSRQPTLIQVVQHGCSQLPKKITDEPLLLHSIVSHKKVIAYRALLETADNAVAAGTSAKSRGGEAATSQIEQQRRFSIPLAYEGWFEILNEDGQAAPPITRVSHLADTQPVAFLVREKTKAYYCNDATSTVAGKEPAPDKSRAIFSGELMAIVGVTMAVLGWRRRRKRSLHCLDEAGKAVYFDCDTRGSYSPVAAACSDDVVGVHRISALAQTFRMPLTVRSVGGRKACSGAAGPGAPGCFRLTEVRTDDVALLLPLRTGGNIVPVSVRTPLQVVEARNPKELRSREDFDRLYKLCTSKAEAYFRTIQVLVSTDKRSSIPAGFANSPSYSRFSRSFSQEEDWVPPSLPPLPPLPPIPSQEQRRTVSEGEDLRSSQSFSEEEDMLFDEVDDLYDYVRRGGEPPKPRPWSWANQGGCAEPLSERSLDDDGRSSSQPILSSNGVMRGRLAELTNGRFPRHGRRSSPTTNSVGSRSTSVPSIVVSAAAEAGAATASGHKNVSEKRSQGAEESSSFQCGSERSSHRRLLRQDNRSDAQEAVPSDSLSCSSSVPSEVMTLPSSASEQHLVVSSDRAGANNEDEVTKDAIEEADAARDSTGRRPVPSLLFSTCSTSATTLGSEESWQSHGPLPTTLPVCSDIGSTRVGGETRRSFSGTMRDAAPANTDIRYATLEHPSAASRRIKMTQIPNRSTGDLVRLFEKLTTGGPESCTIMHPAVLTLRRGSRGAGSEGRPQEPTESEAFDTASNKSVSDSIKRRITTLKLNARAIMV